MDQPWHMPGAARVSTHQRRLDFPPGERCLAKSGRWFYPGFFRRLVEHVLSRRYFKQELELIDFHLTLNRGEVDLLKRYPTELTGGDASADRARPWQFTEGDVFRVSRFDFEVGSELRIETGPVDLGIGHCVDGAVWAVLIPGIRER